MLLPPASEGWGKVIFSVCSHLQGGGGTPSQVWTGRYPIPGLDGVAPHPADGYPISGPDRGYAIPGPDGGGGLPPSKIRMVYPPPLPIRRQISITSTCYAAGSMPLAFTQEDFLALNIESNIAKRRDFINSSTEKFISSSQTPSNHQRNQDEGNFLGTLLNKKVLLRDSKRRATRNVMSIGGIPALLYLGGGGYPWISPPWGTPSPPSQDSTWSDRKSGQDQSTPTYFVTRNISYGSKYKVWAQHVSSMLLLATYCQVNNGRFGKIQHVLTYSVILCCRMFVAVSDKEILSVSYQCGDR